jgi:hypothetical protein
MSAASGPPTTNTATGTAPITGASGYIYREQTDRLRTWVDRVRQGGETSMRMTVSFDGPSAGTS